MKKSFSHLVAAALTGIPLLAANAALADRLEKCPVASDNPAEVADSVKAAPSCAQAYEVMNVCRANAAGDVALGAIVIEMCEKVFMPTIDPSSARSYQMVREACARKFAHQGAQGASFQATCEAGMAVVFAHRADLAAMRAKRDPKVSPYGTPAPNPAPQ
jgi:hypothetical protein